MEASPAEVGPSKVGLSEVGPSEAGIAEVGPAEAGPTKTGPREGVPREGGLVKVWGDVSILVSPLIPRLNTLPQDLPQDLEMLRIRHRSRLPCDDSASDKARSVNQTG